MCSSGSLRLLLLRPQIVASRLWTAYGFANLSRAAPVEHIEPWAQDYILGGPFALGLPRSRVPPRLLLGGRSCQATCDLRGHLIGVSLSTFDLLRYFR